MKRRALRKTRRRKVDLERSVSERKITLRGRISTNKDSKPWVNQTSRTGKERKKKNKKTALNRRIAWEDEGRENRFSRCIGKGRQLSLRGRCERRLEPISISRNKKERIISQRRELGGTSQNGTENLRGFKLSGRQKKWNVPKRNSVSR